VRQVATDEHRVVAGDPDIPKAHHLRVLTKVREGLVPGTSDLGEASVRAQRLSDAHVADAHAAAAGS